jgi:hypothetical protein
LVKQLQPVLNDQYMWRVINAPVDTGVFWRYN